MGEIFDMSSVSNETRTVTFSPWQMLSCAIKDMGCKDCEHLHGHACSGGKYPRLILLMEDCPLTQTKQSIKSY